MKCTGETNLEGTAHPSKYKALPNDRETLFIEGWNIVQAEVDRLTNLGWKADQLGNRASAHSYYKGANRFFYLIHLAIAVSGYIEDLGILNQKCNSLAAEEKYNLKCVEDSLSCMSAQYGTNYVSAWSNLLIAFGVDRGMTNCEEIIACTNEHFVNDQFICEQFM